MTDTRRDATAALVLGLLAAALLAQNADAGESMYLSGAGSQPCSFLNSRAKRGAGFQQSPVTAMVFGWAQGFMSGMNMSSMSRYEHEQDAFTQFLRSVQRQC
jgi:hypothetical protein